jgi:hypothetical protein
VCGFGGHSSGLRLHLNKVTGRFVGKGEVTDFLAYSLTKIGHFSPAGRQLFLILTRLKPVSFTLDTLPCTREEGSGSGSGSATPRLGQNNKSTVASSAQAASTTFRNIPQFTVPSLMS